MTITLEPIELTTLAFVFFGRHSFAFFPNVEHRNTRSFLECLRPLFTNLFQTRKPIRSSRFFLSKFSLVFWKFTTRFSFLKNFFSEHFFNSAFETENCLFKNFKTKIQLLSSSFTEHKIKSENQSSTTRIFFLSSVLKFGFSELDFKNRQSIFRRPGRRSRFQFSGDDFVS